MENKLALRIGDKVQWYAHGNHIIGVVSEEEEEIYRTVKVITHRVGGVVNNVEVEVEIDHLTLINS